MYMKVFEIIRRVVKETNNGISLNKDCHSVNH